MRYFRGHCPDWNNSEVFGGFSKGEFLPVWKANNICPTLCSPYEFQATGIFQYFACLPLWIACRWWQDIPKLQRKGDVFTLTPLVFIWGSNLPQMKTWNTHKCCISAWFSVIKSLPRSLNCVPVASFSGENAHSFADFWEMELNAPYFDSWLTVQNDPIPVLCFLQIFPLIHWL